MGPRAGLDVVKKKSISLAGIGTLDRPAHSLGPTPSELSRRSGYRSVFRGVLFCLGPLSTGIQILKQVTSIVNFWTLNMVPAICFVTRKIKQ